MIHFRNLSFSYAQNLRNVFENLDLQVQPLSWVAFTGPDGSGKTTLGKLVKGLLIPDSGAIGFDGTSPHGADSVGYLGGDPADFAVGITVEEDVVFGMENVGLPRSEMQERLHEALRLTGMEGMERRLVHTLSGGEQQKLALAGVLAMRVKVLVVDEAFEMLDKPMRRSVRSLLTSLRRDPGLTIIEMTNSVEDMSWADRVVFLSNGAIEFDGTPAEFLAGRLGARWSSMNGGLHALQSALYDRYPTLREETGRPLTLLTLTSHIEKLRRNTRNRLR
ncbi:MAG: ATP-binding cassette domain-containing protein [Desulfomonilaceae bacterium]|nr:ATP-binding cassette domain-containing protein [Desulfomonilaceae bacterium]